ncbi:MAG: class III extradiol ring-cleavage dioxygenase [Gammaproteobacteria bacterium]|jgi:4,5-DOPA dioxygenase extradiol
MNDLSAEQLPMSSLFVAHGAPDLVLSDIPARRFLRSLGRSLARPRAIVVVSAHWVAPELQITPAARLETLHDYYGWQAELYDIDYRAQGADWLSRRVVEVLAGAGYPVTTGARPGLDHGAWVPLLLMYPEGVVPVVQLSLLQAADPEWHFRVGQALDVLCGEGVLVIGSGGAVHNPRRLRPTGSVPDAWARAFDDWLCDRLMQRDLQQLFDFSRVAPHAGLAHPSVEHLMPLFVAMGAGWSDGRVQRLHHSFSYGNLSMACYAFARR